MWHYLLAVSNVVYHIITLIIIIVENSYSKLGHYETSFIALNFYRSSRGDDQWIFHDEMDTSIILCTKLGHLTVKICSRLELPSFHKYVLQEKARIFLQIHKYLSR